MKTKREVLEIFAEDGDCIGINCRECPFYLAIHEGCDINYELVKLGAKIMLENGNIEMKEMNIDALLEDYMNNPKWAGKIFMQDEKTCYMDGLIAGAKEMQEENEQLKAQIEKMKCCANCDYWFDMDSTCELHKKEIFDFMVDCSCKDWECAYKEVED